MIATASKSRKFVGVAGLVTAGALFGGMVAMNTSASATTSATPSPTTSTAKPTLPGLPGDGKFKNDQSPTSVRPDEKALSASDAAKVKAAAESAVPGGTVYRVEADGDGSAFEAHMTKADGTEVTVKLDANFKNAKVEAGMGDGGPQHGPNGRPQHGPNGGPVGDNDGDGPFGKGPAGDNDGDGPGAPGGANPAPSASSSAIQ